MFSLKRWFGNLWGWLVEAWHFWLFLFLSLLVILVVVLMGRSELAFRVAGMLLQLLGVLTILIGIRETRKLFGRPSLAFMLRGWFRRFPRFKPRVYEATGFAEVPRPTVNGWGYTFSTTSPDATLEQRIELLEKRSEYLRNKVDEVRRELEQEVQKVISSVNEEQSARITEDRQILARLEATETGGLHISAMGAVWIFFGIVLSSLPSELARWFG